MKIPKEGNAVVKFGSSWCGPCKTIKPILEELDKENEDVEFVDIDVDEDKELAAKYGVRGIPMLLFIRNGVVERTLVGMQSKEDIQENINLLEE